MSLWLIKATARYLAPVYERLKVRLLKEDILHADETTLQALNEPGRKASQKSYVWLYRTSRGSKEAIVIYEYQETRKTENPKRFLSGYAGYHGLSKGIVVVGCWAHARRKLDEALNVVSSADRASSKVMKGKRYCDALFSIEDKSNTLTPEERTAKRKELAEPILEPFPLK